MLNSIFSSTASNVFKFVLMVGVTFVMTPVYVSALGAYDYGIWEIIGSVVGYLGILDLGLRPTVSRFTARYHHSGTPAERRALFSTSVLLMGAVGCVVAGCFLAWSLLWPQALAPDAEVAGRYALVLQLVALQVLLDFPRYALESVFEGQMQYTRLNNIVLSHTLVGVVVLYNFLHVTDPLVLLCVVGIVTSVSKLAIFWWLLRWQVHGGHRFALAAFSRPMASQLYRFGFKSFVLGIGVDIERSAGVLIIGVLIGPAAVVFYSIPQALATRIIDFRRVLTHALMPAFAAIQSSGEDSRMTGVFLLWSRLILAVVTLLAVGVFVLGEQFIALWMGPEYATNGRPVLWAITFYVLISSTLPLYTRLLTALDAHGILARLSVVSSLVNVGSAIALAQVLGVAGVAMGVAIGHLAVAPFIWRAVFARLDVGIGAYTRAVILPSALAAAVMAAVLLGSLSLSLHAGWLGVFERAFLGGTVFLVCFGLVGTSPADRRWLRAQWDRRVGARTASDGA